jgi:hypothetical protein
MKNSPKMFARRKKIFSNIEKYSITQKSSKNRKTICAPFQKDIFYIFENFEENIEKSKGFTNTIRSLLVENILNHIKIYFAAQSENFNFSFSKMIVQAGIIDNKMDEDTFRKLSARLDSIKEETRHLDFDHNFKMSTGKLTIH